MARYRRVDGSVVEDEDTYIGRTNPASQIIYLITGFVELLLGFRVVLTLLGANQSNAFAQFIYSVTAPFVKPFYGLLNTTLQYGNARLEIEALIAMVVVAVIGGVVARLVALLGA